MGYSPCKMLSFGKKLKIPKRCEKRLYDHIRVVVCKKPLQKTLNIRKMTAFLKMAKIGQDACKVLSLGQKLKMQKRCEKQLYDHIRVVVCKKPLQKYLIFKKWQHFESSKNWPSFMGYIPCKMLSLGQKWKIHKGEKNDCTTTWEF